ncbi:MAG: hypothetical protein J5543_03905 [Bacteroidales bacterium]|nr:hypothetical protein [Bacteroidales bacterium]
MKESRLLSVRLAKLFLVIMALMLFVFIVCYGFLGDANAGGYDEFSSAKAPISTRGKIIAVSLVGFVLAIPFSWALNAIALYVNREFVKGGRFLQVSLVIALIGFFVVPLMLFLDVDTNIHVLGLVAAVPVMMWLISCGYLFRLRL